MPKKKPRAIRRPAHFEQAAESEPIIVEDLVGEKRILIYPNEHNPFVLIHLKGRRARRAAAHFTAMAAAKRRQRN